MSFICVISARNLGDATLHSSVLLELSKRNYSENFLVWTKPEMRFLFEEIPGCEVITSPFPLGTGFNFRLKDWFKLFYTVNKIRRKKPSLTMDLIGDFRERILAKMIGGDRHIHIGWDNGHPFRKLIKNPFFDGTPVIKINKDIDNVYKAYEFFVNAIAPLKSCEHLYIQRILKKKLTTKVTIGIHPFASQKCKLWPNESWQNLILELIKKDFSIVAFCSPNEVINLKTTLGDHINSVLVFSDSLKKFQTECNSLDLLIGLDSFSVHMAQRQGIPTIVLNAGNPPNLWAPPLGLVLGDGGGCKHFPCFNVPRCNGANQFICIKKISFNDVLEVVQAKFEVTSDYG